MLLKQSTAYTRMFKMISSSDHLSLKTTASPVVNISKAGAAFGAAAGAVTEIANGWYKVALTTADTGTLGDLAFYITGTGADDTDFCDQVSAQITSDLMATYTQPTGFLAATFPSGTIANTTNITSITGNITGNLSGSVGSVTAAVTLPSIPANWITAAGINAAALNGKGDWLTAAGYTAPTNLTAAQIATGVWTDAVAGDFTAALSIGKSVMNGVALGTGLKINSYQGDTPQTGDAYARLGAPAGASISADVAAIMAITDTSNVKKNALKNGFMFVMTDSTTHAPKTLLAVTAVRSIDGAAFAACTNAVAEVANGTYSINLSAADMNGDHIMLRFTAAASDDLNIEIVTQP
jgi:hypothetical protein